MIVVKADDWQEIIKPDVPAWWLVVSEDEAVITLM